MCESKNPTPRFEPGSADKVMLLLPLSTVVKFGYLVALAFITVRLFPKASSRTKMALTLSTFSSDTIDFLDDAFDADAAAVVARHDMTCRRFEVFPDPDLPMNTMDWSFL